MSRLSYTAHSPRFHQPNVPTLKRHLRGLTHHSQHHASGLACFLCSIPQFLRTPRLISTVLPWQIQTYTSIHLNRKEGLKTQVLNHRVIRPSVKVFLMCTVDLLLLCQSGQGQLQYHTFLASEPKFNLGTSLTCCSAFVKYRHIH